MEHGERERAAPCLVQPDVANQEEALQLAHHAPLFSSLAEFRLLAHGHATQQLSKAHPRSRMIPRRRQRSTGRPASALLPGNCCERLRRTSHNHRDLIHVLFISVGCCSQ
ncbi:hypothetical protein QOT17_020399 [Balamuthia mandrillaris]